MVRLDAMVQGARYKITIRDDLRFIVNDSDDSSFAVALGDSLTDLWRTQLPIASQGHPAHALAEVFLSQHGGRIIESVPPGIPKGAVA